MELVGNMGSLRVRNEIGTGRVLRMMRVVRRMIRILLSRKRRGWGRKRLVSLLLILLG